MGSPLNGNGGNPVFGILGAVCAVCVPLCPVTVTGAFAGVGLVVCDAWVCPMSAVVSGSSVLTTNGPSSLATGSLSGIGSALCASSVLLVAGESLAEITGCGAV